MKLIAVSGMTGAGKTDVSNLFAEQGFKYLRFGQAVLDEVIRLGIGVNEENEKKVRENMRKEHGMAAMAKFLLPKFDEYLKSTNIIADDLMSWEEYKLLKEKYKDQFVHIAIYANPKIRYERLIHRKLKKEDTKAINRPLTKEQAQKRDYSEIEDLHSAGPIAMADYTIINEGTVETLTKNVEAVIKKILK